MASSTTLRLAVAELSQPVGVFYSCHMPAKTLLDICTFDFRQIKENNGVKEFMGIQRPLRDDRVRDIRKYIRTNDACFPTSVVISVDERCASFETIDGERKLILKPYQDPEQKQIVIPYTAIATIIDGQHRIKAFEDTDQNWDLSVNIFIGIDEGTQAMIFSKVNLAQTKVNKSLVYDLFSLDRERSPEKTCHEIVVNLNEMPESPFHQMIKRLGSATDGIFGETLSQATVVKGLLPYITNDPMTDRDIGRRFGFWPDRGPTDFERHMFYPFFRAKEDYRILAVIINYFSAIRRRWPRAWDVGGTGMMLPRTNGYNASMRFLRDAYLHLTSKPTVPSQDDFYSIFKRSDMADADFRVENFPPGSSGASALYYRFLTLIK